MKATTDTQTAAAEQNAEVAKLAKMIKGIRTAMLSSVEPGGAIHSRPMGTQQVEFDGTLWFFTKASSEKVSEIQRENQVNVSYADDKNASYVSMAGTAELVRDPAKIKELWNPILKAWFEKGLDDPDLALLKVTVDSAQYWDAPSSRLVRLAAIAASALTGTPFKGENATVTLQH